MKKIFFASLILPLIFIFNSCGSPDTESKNRKTIKQKDDGTISLELEKADCYAYIDDRSDNTAEWNVVVKKSGRYDVWISSAVSDTSNFNNKNSVIVNVQDKMLQARPDCDRIVKNSGDRVYPYLADSFLGTLYLKDTGEFYIQVTSEMILPSDYIAGDKTAEELSKLISVSFTPASTR